MMLLYRVIYMRARYNLLRQKTTIWIKAALFFHNGDNIRHLLKQLNFEYALLY